MTTSEGKKKHEMAIGQSLEWHVEANAEIAKSLEILKKLVRGFARKHFLDAEGNTKQNTPGITRQSIELLFHRNTQNICNDRLKGDHAGPFDPLDDLLDERFEQGADLRAVVMAILGNVLVEQILQNEWFGWMGESRRYREAICEKHGVKCNDMSLYPKKMSRLVAH